MKKNDKVILTGATKAEYSNDLIPAGTEMFVWKAGRDGNLRCSYKGKYGSSSLTVKASNVTPVARNCQMPKVGDLFAANWGYEQTQTTWFQITEVKNKNVVVREISEKRTYEGPMNGHAVPVKNSFCSEPQSKVVRFNAEDEPYFKMASYATAFRADESPRFFSEWH